MNVFHDFTEIILCNYAFVKYVFKRTSLKYDLDNFGVIDILYELSCIVVAPILCVPLILLMLPFVIARAIINVYLQLRFGEKYCGLLEYMDNIWRADTNEAKHIITILMFMEYEKSPDEAVIHIKQSMKKTRDIRFTTTVHTILGYTYRLRSDEIVDKMVRLVSLTSEEASNKSKFEEKISNLANQSLPAASAFEILVCAGPITFNNTHGEISDRKHIIIVRLHHSLGDGISIMSYLLKLNNNENGIQHVTKLLTDNYVESNESRKGVFQELKMSSTSLNQFIQKIKDTSLHRVNLLEPADQNILHRPTLTGQKILVFETDSDSIYVPRMKSIRRKLKDCKFSDVLCTAISASLCEYFHQHSQHVPKNVNMSFIVPVPRRSDNPNQPIKYAFSTAALKIPVHIDGYKSAEENLLLRLETVKARREMLQKCIDPLFYYWMCRYTSFLPIGLLKPLIKMDIKNTISLSNLPGLQCTEFGGEKVENIVFCTPHVANMGVGITVHTYRDCLQITLIADKVLVPNSEDARLILKNLYKYIDLLEKGVDSKK